MLWKCCTQYARKFGKQSSGHRTGKGQFSFQSQRKAMLKNIKTTAQLHSSHILLKECSKFSEPGFNSTWTMNFLYFCFTDYAKVFDCVDHNKLWKILKEMGIPDHLICLLRNLYAGQEATVITGHGTTDWFQIGKGQFSFQSQRKAMPKNAQTTAQLHSSHILVK